MQLSIGNFLEFHDVAYIPSNMRILLSSHILDKLGYSFLFDTEKVKLYQDSLLIGTGVLYGNLYRLGFSALPSISTTLIVNTASSSKCLTLNEKYSILWHKCLCHICRQRMERLIKDDILPDLPSTSEVRNAKVDTCTALLRVIHTYICGPFTPLVIGGHKCFITFIDDHSRYGFFELIHEKSNSLEAFKAKVEL